MYNSNSENVYRQIIIQNGRRWYQINSFRPTHGNEKKWKRNTRNERGWWKYSILIICFNISGNKDKEERKEGQACTPRDFVKEASS